MDAFQYAAVGFVAVEYSLDGPLDVSLSTYPESSARKEAYWRIP
jgi:hypothetical protein